MKTSKIRPSIYRRAQALLEAKEFACHAIAYAAGGLSYNYPPERILFEDVFEFGSLRLDSVREEAEDRGEPVPRRRRRETFSDALDCERDVHPDQQTRYTKAEEMMARRIALDLCAELARDGFTAEDFTG